MLRVKVVGFDDGEKVAKQVFLVDTDQELIQFGSQFDDIDEVRFTAKGGRDANLTDDLPLSNPFGVDDLFIAYQPLSNLSGANDLFNF